MDAVADGGGDGSARCAEIDADERPGGTERRRAAGESLRPLRWRGLAAAVRGLRRQRFGDREEGADPLLVVALGIEADADTGMAVERARLPGRPHRGDRSRENNRWLHGVEAELDALADRGAIGRDDKEPARGDVLGDSADDSSPRLAAEGDLRGEGEAEARAPAERRPRHLLGHRSRVAERFYKLRGRREDALEEGAETAEIAGPK